MTFTFYPCRHVAKIKVCKRYYDKINGVDDINTDGLTARQSYYKRNREKVIARQREYYQRNANKVKERRVQHYRTKAVQNQGADEQHIPIFQKSTAYLERHKEYYEKNRETIKERRRNYYHMTSIYPIRKQGVMFLVVRYLWLTYVLSHISKVLEILGLMYLFMKD